MGAGPAARAEAPLTAPHSSGVPTDWRARGSSSRHSWAKRHGKARAHATSTTHHTQPRNAETSCCSNHAPPARPPSCPAKAPHPTHLRAVRLGAREQASRVAPRYGAVHSAHVLDPAVQSAGQTSCRPASTPTREPRKVRTVVLSRDWKMRPPASGPAGGRGTGQGRDRRDGRAPESLPRNRQRPKQKERREGWKLRNGAHSKISPVHPPGMEPQACAPARPPTRL